MNHAIRRPRPKPLKQRLCVFCVFVRGHEGETSPIHAHGTRGEPLIHNNNNNNNIYINDVEGSCVVFLGIAWMAVRRPASLDSLMVPA